MPCNSGNATGPYQIRAEGFASNALRVYDVTDSLLPVRLAVDASHVEFDGVEYSISFQDVSGGERRQYVVFDQPKRLPPERLSAVTRRNLAGGPPSGYLIVVPEAWLDVANTLADLRRSEGHAVSADHNRLGATRSPRALRALRRCS